ncbi:hypothetical protein [Methyloversatilis discipulorum]|uniref:hypothetical protein n=1 Tax=Methyloversatilis discipulorum TaxID=1119528 RepID=UPI0012F72360|nr:hypothetical protein [Methyloversatilis discipulorum]
MAERIHTYFSYDGETDLPKEGIADFQGKPHYFWLSQCSSEPRAGLYELAPIDAELLALARERESIWHEWDLAYHAGKVGLATHPIQPGNSPRYVELTAQIAQRAEVIRATTRTAIGTVSTSADYLDRMRPFVGQKWPVPGTYSPELEVEWRHTP